MFCEKCRNNLPDNAKFCNKCGYQVIEIETVKDREQIERDKKANRRNMKVVIIVLAAIFIPLIGISIYDETHKSPDSQKNSTENSLLNNAEKWKEYNSLIGEFKVLLPTLPDHDTEDYKIPNTNLVLKMDQFISAQEDGTAYVVGFMK